MRVFVLDYTLLQSSTNQRKELGQMKKFDSATYERVLAARREGKTLKEISTETGVCLTLVKNWLKDAAGQKIPESRSASTTHRRNGKRFWRNMPRIIHQRRYVQNITSGKTRYSAGRSKKR